MGRRFVRRHAPAGAELEQPPALTVATQDNMASIRSKQVEETARIAAENRRANHLRQ